LPRTPASRAVARGAARPTATGGQELQAAVTDPSTARLRLKQAQQSGTRRGGHRASDLDKAVKRFNTAEGDRRPSGAPGTPTTTYTGGEAVAAA